MKNKFLYANGCSFVYGDELISHDRQPKNEQWRWSRKFSEDYGFEEINQSCNGSSNDRIYRTTKDWILDNQDKIKNTFVVIGWSQVERTERYNDIANMYESINFGVKPNQMTCENGIDATGKLCTSEDFGPFLGKCPTSNFWKEYIKYYYNEEYFIEQTISKVIALKLILETFDIKYYFYFSLITPISPLDELGLKSIFDNKYEKLLDFKKICNVGHEYWIKKEVKKRTGGEVFYNNDKDQWVNSKGGWTGFSGGHPDKKSHKLWSEFLYKEYKRLYK